MTGSRRPYWFEAWEHAGLRDLAAMLIPYEPDTEQLVRYAEVLPEKRDKIKQMLVHRCIARGLALHDPFHPHPRVEQLQRGEIVVGTVPGIAEFGMSLEELRTGAVIFGAPKAGKTTLVIHLIVQLLRFAVGCFVPDRRGDFFALAGKIPGAILIPFSEDRINPFEPPIGLTWRQWLPILAARLTYDLRLELAGFVYCYRLLLELYRRAESKGLLPTMHDFAELLERQHPTPRSSEEGYLQRLRARIIALISLLGEDAVNVQRGFPIEELLQHGRLVVKDLRIDERVADFVTSIHLFKLYFSRIYQPSLSRRLVTVVLDEARNLIRAKSHEFGVPDIENLFTRSRYTALSLLVAEQVATVASDALLQSCWLKIAFNSSGVQQTEVGKLMGLSPDQTDMLSTLAPGRCIARLGGDRLPHPFPLQIPYPDILR